jgi:hypothetical protein
MPRSMAVFSLFALTTASACALWPEEKHHYGDGTVNGTVEGLVLTTGDGQAIVLDGNNGLATLKIGPSLEACERHDGDDHLSIDLSGLAPGRYTVAKGYPTSETIAQIPYSARAHACPADSFIRQLPCHEGVQKDGLVIITRADGGPGGRVDGSFDISFTDGHVVGTFSAFRCE